MVQSVVNLLPVLVCAVVFAFCTSPRNRHCPPCEPCPSCPTVEPKSAGANSEPAQWLVIDVIDGDTLIVRKDKPIQRKETVRLLRIDTPERDEPGYAEAREALKHLVRKGVVTLEFEKRAVESRDGFGRLLAYVIADGVNTSIEIVRLGWSPFWTKYGKGRLADEFTEAEKEARSHRAGMWGKER